MSTILIASGFKHLETLQEFSTRFPDVKGCFDNDLEKIWICHKDEENIPKFEEVNSLTYQSYFYLLEIIKRKIASEKEFLSLLTEFTAISIFKKIYAHFDIRLTTYIFTKCYVFYNWGVNAFEPVLDHFEIHKKIEESQKNLSKRKKKSDCNFFGQNVGKGELKKNMIASNKSKPGKSVDLFQQPTGSSYHSKSKVVPFKLVKGIIDKNERVFDLTKNSKNPYQETFNLNKVLYDIKQKPQWPKNHVLSKHDVEELLLYIIKIPVRSNASDVNKLLGGHKNWLLLREFLRKFIKAHEAIEKNNGYGRILKHHLKKGISKAPAERRLIPISKSVVASYILDVLRRVLPLELFGSNHSRKKFFSCLVKVLNGRKEESFIWHQLLQVLLVNKSQLTWCSEINNNYAETQMILKLFKFIIIHYVFILLKNNFYITETGSSGFTLRFYRKSDMESASSACLNSLLYYKHVSILKKRDYDLFSIERKWVDTGVIDKMDFKRKPKKTMCQGTEYKQPIASVRFLPKNEGTDQLRLITNIIKREKNNQTSENQKLITFFLERAGWRKRRLYFLNLLLDFLVDKMGYGIKPVPNNPKLEAAWSRAVELKEKFGKLYFVKADIADAFDSVEHNLLGEIIQNALDKELLHESIQVRRIIEWKRINGKIQKVARFSFSNHPKENSVMINRSFFLHHKKKINQYYDSKFVDILKQVVMHQRIEIKGRVFKLIKGLAQGSAGKFSPKLCEIYYSSMDKLYFGEFIKSNRSILLRGVDDYLFITSDLEKGKIFLEMVRQGIEPFNARFNNNKLKSNLIEAVQEVPYLGLIFNFDNMSVRPNYSKYRGRDLMSTMNLNDKWGNIYFNRQRFLERRSLRLNSLKLHPILLSRFNNDLKKIRQTVFQACLMQALRVMTLACYLYDGRIKNDLLVFNILVRSCSRIQKLVARSCCLSRDEVKWLFLYGALNIFRKRSGQFKSLLVIITYNLQKCERTFVNNGTELLLDFLKSDVLEEEHWKSVETVFGKLGNKSSKN